MVMIILVSLPEVPCLLSLVLLETTENKVEIVPVREEDGVEVRDQRRKRVLQAFRPLHRCTPRSALCSTPRQLLALDAVKEQ